MVLKGETPFFNEGYIKTVAAVGGVEAVEKGNFPFREAGKGAFLGWGQTVKKTGKLLFSERGPGHGWKSPCGKHFFCGKPALAFYIFPCFFFAFFKKKEPKGKIPPFNTPLPP